MSLSERKEKQLKKQPVIQTVVKKSQDGRFLVHKTTITDVKPINYYQAVFDSKGDF